MDRTTRRTYALLGGGLSSLALLCGCNHSPTDGAPPDRAAVNPRCYSAPAEMSLTPGPAPGLLLAPEIAVAEPLPGQAAICDFQTGAAADPAPAAAQSADGASPPVAPGAASAPALNEARTAGEPALANPAPTGDLAASNGAPPSFESPELPPYQPAAPALAIPPRATTAGPLLLNRQYTTDYANAQIWDGHEALAVPTPSPGDRGPATFPSQVRGINSTAIAAELGAGPQGLTAPTPNSLAGNSFRAAATLPPISPELNTARRQADETVRRGFGLAERGALFSARCELLQALRDLADALDAAHGGMQHAQALAAGLRAEEEADDFQPKGAQVISQLPMAVLIESHQTPILKERAEGISPLQARQQYLNFAQEQLAAAVEQEPIGSLALFALAKIQVAIDVKNPSDGGSGVARAITYHRAALLVEPNNFLAANDLGVLLAKQGRWEEARSVLLSSLRVSPQVVTWQNLATVHRTLREGELAAQAQREGELLAQQRGAQASKTSVAVQWLDTAAFAQTSANNAVDRAPGGRPAAQTAQKLPPPSDENRRGSGLFSAPPLSRN